MKYDIVFVGSGMACVTTLTQLCRTLLQTDKLPAKPVSIAVIEKQSEFWAGLPYGDRSSVNCLTITTYAEFLNDPAQFEEFNSWLIQHDNHWIEEYLELGGHIAAQWYARNKQVIDAGQIATIAIPRYLYGKFKREQLLKLIQASRKRGLVFLSTIRGETIAVTKSKTKNHKVEVRDSDGVIKTISTKKLVLTTGNMPYRKMKVLQDAPASRFIPTAYEPGIAQTLVKIEKALAATPDPKHRNLLLVGSNASSIELLYLLGSHEGIIKLINKIVVLSPGGKLPLAAVDTGAEKQFTYFDQLAHVANCHPDMVFEAMMKEFALHFANDVCTSTVHKLLVRTRQLLSHLTGQEYAHFLMQRGPAFSKLIRRSIADYLYIVNQLRDKEQFMHLPGKLTNVSTIDGYNGPLVMEYEANGQRIQHPQPFSMVVGCSGFETFEECTCPLINDVLKKGLCQINSAGIGIQVNNDFEASPNLYVTGPLVAGTVNDVLQYWHLENLSRLLQLAPYLSAALLKGMFTEKRAADSYMS